jgi:uncharacterized protein (DUF58 family)
MLTARGRAALGLGAAAYVGAWAFGAQALYPAAVGLPLAVLLAWGWVRLVNRPMRLRRAAWGAHHVEGDDVPVDVEIVHDGPVVPASVLVVERVAKLGERRTELERRGKKLRARYVLEHVPRGRYRTERAEAVLEDPFGLERVVVDLPTASALLVYPRVVDLDGLFSESGAYAHDGRRALLRRTSGFDLHSVREYEHGESTRKVHWRSTARRGELMVKELEDAPRDEVAVLLDADEAAVAGTPPDSSFDAQVRAAAAILRTHVRRGRSCVLVVSARTRDAQRVRAEDHEWQRALELLAAAEPAGRVPAAALVGEEAGPAARALELAVVTSRLTPDLVDRLVQRAASRRGVSLVYVDAATFGRGGGRTAEPGLLRLQSLGVPVAVVRRGDDLAAALGTREAQEAIRHG